MDLLVEADKLPIRAAEHRLSYRPRCRCTGWGSLDRAAHHRNLALELLRVTEAGPLAAAPLQGEATRSPPTGAP